MTEVLPNYVDSFMSHVTLTCPSLFSVRDDWRFSFRCFDCIVVCVCVGKVEAIWGGAGIFVVRLNLAVIKSFFKDEHKFREREWLDDVLCFMRHRWS